MPGIKFLYQFVLLYYSENMNEFKYLKYNYTLATLIEINMRLRGSLRK